MYDSSMTTASKKLTNTLKFGEIVQHDGYTIQEAGTVEIAGTSYQVRLQENAAKGDFKGSLITWLVGPRGAEYTLEPLSLIESTGKFRIQSFSSGAFLRRGGNEVKVFMFGNLLEEI